MINRTLARVIRSSKISIRTMGDHHGPMMPPFGRQRPATTLIPEETELVWDDTVSPETCIDFDAPQADSFQVFGSFFAMFSFLGLIALGVAYSDPQSKNPVVPKREILDLNALRRDLGMPMPILEEEE